jgi:hypothetical protein
MKKKIVVADLQYDAVTDSNVWRSIPAQVTQGEGTDRFHVVLPNGSTLWGITAAAVEALAAHGKAVA